MTMTKISDDKAIVAGFLKPNDTVEIVHVEVNICDRCENLHIFLNNEAGTRIAGLMIGIHSADHFSVALDKAILGLLKTGTETPQ